MARSRRAPYVAVRTDVVKDEGFAVLGDIAGYNRHEALGRMFALWAFCRDRGLEDAPGDSRGYVVRDAVVRRFLGSKGVEAILADGCDEFALAERLADGLIYLRGTSETVAALRAHAATSAAGGQARACGNRDTVGRFSAEESVSETTIVQPEATRTPPEHPPESSVPPSSFLLRSPSEKNDSQARRPPGAAVRVEGHWKARFERAHGSSPTLDAGSRRLADRLLKKHSADEICKRIDLAFDEPPDFPRHPYPFATFVQFVDKFIRSTGIRPTRLL